MKYDTEIWNSQKYLIEATIPEMSTCTDCILSRLTIINVEQADLGNYYINATTTEFPSEFGRITLYRQCSTHRSTHLTFFSLETPDCQQFITHRDNKGCKRIYTQLSSADCLHWTLLGFISTSLLLLL
jgi:hypothetical protein